MKMLLAIPFFFLLLSVSTFAYQEFNSNPTFSNSLNGYRVFDTSYNTTGYLCIPFTNICAFNTNNTYQCFTGTGYNNTATFTNNMCLGNTTRDNYIIIFPTKDNSFVHTNLFSQFNITNENLLNTFLAIPRNKETIIYLNYTLNANF